MFINKENKKLSFSTQSFSTTDLSKTEDIGIVFPLKTAEDTFSFSHIVDLKDGGCKIKCSETRIASAKEDEIVYRKGRNITYVKSPIKVIKASKMEKELFNTPDTVIDDHYIVTDNATLLPDFISLLDSIDYEIDVFVDSKNLSKKESISFWNGTKKSVNNPFSLDTPVYTQTPFTKEDYKLIKEYLKKMGYKDFFYTLEEFDKLILSKKKEILHKVANAFVGDKVNFEVNNYDASIFYEEYLVDILDEAYIEFSEELTREEKIAEVTKLNEELGFYVDYSDYSDEDLDLELQMLGRYTNVGVQ